MSGLIDAVDKAMYAADRIPEGMAHAAVLAVADWLDPNGMGTDSVKVQAAAILRAATVPDEPAPAVKVILDWMMSEATGSELGDAEQLAAQLTDAGLLREATP